MKKIEFIGSTKYNNNFYTKCILKM
jgi:hypothetical protein